MILILNNDIVNTYKYSIIIIITGLIFLILSLFLNSGTFRNVCAWIGAVLVLIGVALFTYLYWSRKYQQQTIVENTNFIKDINSYIK